MSEAAEPITADQLTIVPANEASWDDLRAVFGTTGEPGRCHCQYYKVRDFEWRALSETTRLARLREQTACGDPKAPSTSGLVAYLGGGPGGGPGGEPVGWCAIEPRTAYPRLLRTRTPWTGRDEDRTDDGVWAVTCFVTRKGFRRRGITYALARATVGYAREHGARAVEAYTMITQPGKEITWGELHVGSRDVFADAGFTEVSHPSPRRVVMRVDF
ncbi:GNAT family N-acetyltransferase [Streptomyces sp. NBC_01537]|uniref:GNAT family N-acetyltransferase n=1 Tax=Streptomyces sp. NBC_01537 TaxID=2903896 RepID=UPI003867336D